MSLYENPEMEENSFHTANENTEENLESQNNESVEHESENSSFPRDGSEFRYQEPNYSYSYRPDDGDVNKSAKRKKDNKKKRSVSVPALIAIALCCAILGGAAGTAFSSLFSGRKNIEQPSEVHDEIKPDIPTVSAGKNDEANSKSSTVFSGRRPASEITHASIELGNKLSVSDVYAQNVGSTVGIQTQITTNYWGYTTNSAASGSGFILTDDGYVITNYHVIEDANSVTVMTYDGKSYEAEVIGYDENNDVAVLKIEAENLVPIVLGSSDALSVGEQVVAIGNPLGELTFSLTSGYVSALNREITMSNNLTMNLIQTDCAINSGNSGGPLFNLYGEVIGITNAKLSSSSSSSSASIDNIGFAIPIDDIRSTIFSIIENGYFAKPYIGVTVSTVSSDMINYGLPAGAIVKEIVEGSPAEASGLQVNDIITKANDEEITSSASLVSYVTRCGVGESISLSIYRDGNSIDITLTVGEKQESALPEKDNQNTGSGQQSQQYQQPYNYYNWPFGYFGFGNGNQQSGDNGNS